MRIDQNEIVAMAHGHQRVQQIGIEPWIESLQHGASSSFHAGRQDSMATGTAMRHRTYSAEMPFASLPPEPPG